MLRAVGFASPAGAYGGGANHDMWQIGFSFNCDNPSICNTPEFGGTGGDWGWAEFDRSADGTKTWGDSQSTFCFHTIGGGGGGGRPPPLFNTPPAHSALWGVLRSGT